MRNFVRKHKILTGSIAVVVGLILWSGIRSVTASARGELVARYDVYRGALRGIGLWSSRPWRPEYAQLLQERYGSNFVRWLLCIVSRTLVAYVDSYDTRQHCPINRKFGHDVFEECWQEARKNWEQAHRSARRGS